MSIVDKLTPVYYKILRLGIQREGGEIVATYDLAILNAAGQRIGTDTPSSALSSETKAALAAEFNADKAAYEAATGLEEWEGE
jgi:hypothetical protein